MAGSVFDQVHLSGLFDAGEVARLFSASAEIRAMMVAEGTLAKVQGAAGVIPEISAKAIHRASLELQLDPSALAAPTATNGVAVPALVSLFRDAMQAPEHAQYLHWGATSQDIIDTGLMLRLRQAASLIDNDLRTTLSALADLADTHADSPMAARTYGQQAAPTSFGAVVASWGWPVLRAQQKLARCTFPVSLFGAVGTSSALGPDPDALRTAMANALGLSVPDHAWHTDRAPVLDFAHAMTTLTQALEKMAEDLIAMVQSELGEIRLGGAGSSSTMPQKQNPVAPSAIVACARTARGLSVALDAGATHKFQRDGASWFTEWMVLPQLVLGAATAVRHAAAMVPNIEVNTEQMRASCTADGLLFSETLTFALAQRMPRPDAAAAVKALATEVRQTGSSLQELAHTKWPDLPKKMFDPSNTLGTAPADARNFAKAARA